MGLHAWRIHAATDGWHLRAPQGRGPGYGRASRRRRAGRGQQVRGVHAQEGVLLPGAGRAGLRSTRAANRASRTWALSALTGASWPHPQSVGMAKALTEELPKAKEMFEQASEILGYDLLKVCVEGPEDKLNTTAVSQPAIYVASLAAVEKLRVEKGDDFLQSIDVCCGLSLG